MKQLHILNGDASVPAFEATGLTGDVLVWREILASGPADGSLEETEFWQQRQHYITSTFPETPAGYDQKIQPTLRLLAQAPAFDEVLLWFDADLICQVNLLYLLRTLQQQATTSISFCKAGTHEAIGLLPPERLKQIYDHRLHLQPAHLQQAEKLWELYAGADPLALQTFLDTHDLQLPYLQQSLYLHLKRFPDCRTGLGHPEQLLLQLVQHGANTVSDLMQAFWKQDPGYGFGDWQLEVLLASLQPHLLSATEPLELTPTGQQVLQQRIKADQATDKAPWLGGVPPAATFAYCFNRQSGKLEAASEDFPPSL